MEKTIESLDSFDNSKKKCTKCKKYFKTLDKEKTICFNCNARNVNKILAEIFTEKFIDEWQPRQF